MFMAVPKMLDNEACRGYLEYLLQLIRAKVDGHVDGDPLNDWIIDPEAQHEICMKLDDILDYLEALSSGLPRMLA